MSQNGSTELVSIVLAVLGSRCFVKPQWRLTPDTNTFVSKNSNNASLPLKVTTNKSVSVGNRQYVNWVIIGASHIPSNHHTVLTFQAIIVVMSRPCCFKQITFWRALLHPSSGYKTIPSYILLTISS